MNFVVFVAKRLFKNHENRKGASQLAVNIATGGVAIGIAVMIISVCVVLGFKQEIKDKLIGFGSHIQIQNYQSLISSESYPIAVNDSLLRIVRSTPNIAHWERTCYKAGILKTEEQFKGVLLKGVAEEFDTTFIHKSLISGSLPRFNDQKASNEILISETAAKEMKLHTGDKISAYFFDNGIRARRFLVKGIYQTNLAELDNNIILTLVRALGNPILTMSIHDEDEVVEYSTDPELIHEKYRDEVDLVVDGGYGALEPSTVVSCLDDEFEVIRPGKGTLV